MEIASISGRITLGPLSDSLLTMEGEIFYSSGFETWSYLTIPISRHAVQEFGRSTQSLPLFFGSNPSGPKPFSKAKILQLPIEVLFMIVQSVPKASSSSLALVNSDCRQLARSRQFASLNLDYSPTSYELVKKLQAEAEESSASGPVTHAIALGPCVRHLRTPIIVWVFDCVIDDTCFFTSRFDGFPDFWPPQPSAKLCT